MNETKPSGLMLWLHMEGGDNALFNRWHNQEHIPQRMAIPGFLSSIRYFCPHSGSYFCYYRLQNQAVLNSKLYHQQNKMVPTELTKQVGEKMRLENRKVADLLWSEGNAHGGLMVTAILSVGTEVASTLSESLQVELARWLPDDMICSARLYHVPEEKHSSNFILMVENANGDNPDEFRRRVATLVDNQKVECEAIKLYQLQYFQQAN